MNSKPTSGPWRVEDGLVVNPDGETIADVMEECDLPVIAAAQLAGAPAVKS